MDRWNELEAFIQAAELGSLTRAAEQLDISTSAASRHLLALEERLGVRLVHRTTRRLHLTEAGEQFFLRARDLLANMKEAEASVSEAAINPTGTLRVTASLSFCLQHLAPLVPEFTSQYPNISVDIVAANRYYDMIENGIDIAIRTRQFEADSSITIRKLAVTPRLLAASPTYLEKQGRPQTPADLSQHKFLLYTLADKPYEFRLRKKGEEQVVPVRPLLSANDGQIVRAAALDGLGILAQPAYIIYDDLKAGRLVRVLEDWDLPRLTMNIAFPTKAHLPAKVRLFIEFLTARFRDKDYERRWNATQLSQRSEMTDIGAARLPQTALLDRAPGEPFSQQQVRRRAWHSRGDVAGAAHECRLAAQPTDRSRRPTNNNPLHPQRVV